MNLFKLGLVLVFAGMILAVVAMFLPLLITAPSSISVSSGGCVIVGFIPICFGVGEHALPVILIALVLAIVLVAISLVLTIYTSKKTREIVKHYAGV